MNTFAINNPKHNISIQVQDSQRKSKYEPISKGLVYGEENGIYTQKEILSHVKILAE